MPEPRAKTTTIFKQALNPLISRSMAASSAQTNGTPLPYWQVNVPPQEREESCPDFLRNISERDQKIISTLQNDYKLQTWDELKADVAANRLDIFQRTPMDLRRYLAFNYGLVKQYGSLLNFIREVRLQWPTPVVASGHPPFSEAGIEAGDVKVLPNDWPYGIEPGVLHLVVWLKFELEEAGDLGDLSVKARNEIDEYVDKYFVERCGRENVLWFRNWAKLKSVHAVEHFHVMLRNPDPAFVKEITKNDLGI